MTPVFFFTTIQSQKGYNLLNDELRNNDMWLMKCNRLSVNVNYELIISSLNHDNE